MLQLGDLEMWGHNVRIPDVFIHHISSDKQAVRTAPSEPAMKATVRERQMHQYFLSMENAGPAQETSYAPASGELL